MLARLIATEVWDTSDVIVAVLADRLANADNCLADWTLCREP